ncbi:MAG: hypothetical protein V1872_02190 [bacterium]
MLKLQKVLPHITFQLSKRIIATPVTFSKYTSNSGGAAFGWTSTNRQLSSFLIPARSSIEGLYLTGHWVTLGMGQGGIPSVAFSGRYTATLVLQFLNIKNNIDTVTLCS